MLHHVLGLLLRGGSVLLSLAEEQFGQLILLDADLVVVSHLVEDDLSLEGVEGALLDLSPEVVGVVGLLLGLLEVLLDRHASLGQLLADLLTTGLKLGVDEGGRQLDVNLGDNFLEDLVTSVGSLVQTGHVLEGGAQVGTHLVDGVELADELGEVVVNGRELLFADLGDGDLDVGLLAAQRATDESGVEVGGLAGLQTGDRLVESLEHALRAHLVSDAGSGGVLQGLTVAGPSQVDGNEVILGGSALDFSVGGETLAQGLDALVDVLVRHLDGGHLDGDGGEIRQVELRTDVHLCGELDDLTVLQLGHLDLGLTKGNDLILLDGLAVSGGQRVVDGLLKDDATAETLVDDRSRHLSLTEAGDVHLVGNVLVGLVKAGLQFIEGHLDRELHTVGAELLKGAGHEVSPVVPILSSPFQGTHIPSDSSDVVACEPMRRLRGDLMVRYPRFSRVTTPMPTIPLGRTQILE